MMGSDLIWIGNTLYPRWIVFAAIGVAFVIISAIFTVITSKTGE